MLDSELSGEYVVGIVVYGQFGHIYMGKYKNDSGLVLPYSDNDRQTVLLKTDLTKSFPIKFESMTLGKVELFIDTDTFERNQGHALIIELSQIGVVSIFFILVLFYAIKRALLAPMGRLQVARKTFESMGEAIAFTDENGLIYDTNPAFLAITRLPREQIINQKINRFFPGALEQMKSGDALNPDYNSWRGEADCHCISDTSIPVWLTVSAVNSSNEKSSRKDEYIFVFQDISSRKEAEQKLEKLAFFDVLTDLPNRQYFENELESSIQLVKRQSQKLGLIFIDLDNFKHVNDSLGHAAGDEVLVEIAKRFKSRIRDSDFLARMGGDEFTIMARNISDSQQVANLAQDINEIAAMPIIINDIEFKAGASIGISMFPDDASSASELIKNADIAMYHAKDLGKGQFSFYSSELNEKIERYFDLRTKIDSAIINSEFELYYQPKVDLFSNRVVAAEALIRWLTPDGNVVGPDTFIPLLEETKQIIHVGRWVIEEAVGQLAKWKNTKNTSLALSVNLSAVQLYDERLIDFLQSILRASSINPEQLEIEITESAIIQDADKAINILKQIKELGIKLSLDDFGTGYSSLSYLRLLPVDILKIDRSFLAGAAHGNVSGNILTSIIKLAEVLSIEVVAEGIEDKQHLELLKSQNCRLGQGYYFSPPLPIEKFEMLDLDVWH